MGRPSAQRILILITRLGSSGASEEEEERGSESPEASDWMGGMRRRSTDRDSRAKGRREEPTIIQ